MIRKIIDDKFDTNRSYIIETNEVFFDENTKINELLIKSNKEIKVDSLEKIKAFNKNIGIGRTKVCIIQNAHNMNKQCSNGLLKMLEEPNNICFFLVTKNMYLLPETILSRCITIIDNSIDESLNSKIETNVKNIDDMYDYTIDELSNYIHTYISQSQNVNDKNMLYMLKSLDMIKKNINIKTIVDYLNINLGV